MSNQVFRRDSTKSKSLTSEQLEDLHAAFTSVSTILLRGVWPGDSRDQLDKLFHSDLALLPIQLSLLTSDGGETVKPMTH